jgi:hypothetical protein
MTRLCSIEGCGKPHLARGWCRQHWNRWRREGDPLHQAKKGAPLNFLMSLIGTAETECIKWPHSVINGGYGSVFFDGKRRTAHRTVCRLQHGEPPFPGAQAAHSCGKGHEGCVNPNHLYWATRVENAADMVRHGRSTRGRRHNTILSEADVISIRAQVAAGKTRTAVAKDYGVTRNCISLVCSRTTWGHIP